MNKPRSGAGPEGTELEHLFSGDPVPTGLQRRDQLVAFVVGRTAGEVEALILTTDSVRSVAERLAGVYGVQLEQAAALLGLDERTVCRASRSALSPESLDRLLLACNLFANVAGVLGIGSARAWFQAANRALNDQAPIQLLGSRGGEQQVQQLIGALLDGAYP